MAFDAFLKIEGIEGDSQSKSHPGHIEVESFSWGETNAGGPGKGTGAGAGKIQMQDFHFQMKTSKASPVLMTSCASGKHFSDATLSCRKAGGEQRDFLVVKMNDVLISSYTISGSDGDDTPGDEVSLAFVKIDMVFVEQDDRGGVLGG